MAQTEFERGALWGMNYLQRRIVNMITSTDVNDVVLPKEEAKK